ncbi:MAG: winged helix-turn-helix transcriptional regulator, partial [Anaerolineales bacterium]
MDLSQNNRELILLEEISHDPDINQATLAEKLDVAVGTVNWHIKRLIAKGYVKAKRAQRKKLRYIITPEGIALRAKLTVQYIDNQMRLYRETREHVKQLLAEAKSYGFHQVKISGESEIAVVCRLTCIEQGFEIGEGNDLPRLVVNGYTVSLVSDQL